MHQNQRIRWLIKPTVFIASLLPFAWLLWNGIHDQLGANPIETITRHTGDWTLRFLLITLTVTPLRRVSGWHGLIRLRRMLGLFTFYYACLHFLTYIWLDQYFALEFILEDILEHKYIMVGFTSFLLLLPLAITSTKGMLKRLGGKRWQQLHRLVYLIAVGGVTHFLWLTKSDLREPALYALALALLLGYRLLHRYRTRSEAGYTRTKAVGSRLEAKARI